MDKAMKRALDRLTVSTGTAATQARAQVMGLLLDREARALRRMPSWGWWLVAGAWVSGLVGGWLI